MTLVLVLACGGDRAPVVISSPIEVHVARPDTVHPAADEDEAELDPWDGTGWWEGQGEQNDGQTWDLRLRVDGAERFPCAIVEYPEIPCSGEWRCLEASTETRLVGVERILKGLDHCIDGCDFEADLLTGAMSFNCLNEGITSRVRMHRAD